MSGDDFRPQARVPVCGGVHGCAIVAIVGKRVPRCVIDIEPRYIPFGWRERLIAAIDERRQRERREILMAAQGLDRRRIAHAVVDAEVHVARLHTRHFVSIR